MPEPTYIYKARATRVIDGDTFLAKVDLGFAAERGEEGISNPIRVRIRNLWAPEMSTADGPYSRDELIGIIMNESLVIQSYKDTRSMERWVCDVWVRGATKTVAEVMIERGFGSATK